MKNLNLKFIIICSLYLLAKVTDAQSPNWLWAKGVGGSAFDIGESVAADAFGNRYMAGSFNSYSMSFDSIILTNTTPGFYDGFLVKYGPEGNVRWVRGPVGTDNDWAKSVTTDASGNSYLAGNYYSSTLTFGSILLTNAGNSDVYVAKYDAEGNILWAKSAGGEAGEEAWGIATDPGGNLLFTGSFGSSSITFGSFTLTHKGMFLVKYDPDGNVLWARSAVDSSYAYPDAVATDASGNSFVTGWFWGDTLSFGTIKLANTDPAYYDVFLVKYDPEGNVLWAKSAGGTNIDHGTSVAVDAAGNCFVGGYFISPIMTFDTIILTIKDSSFAYTGLFLAKYDPDGNVLWAHGTQGMYNDDVTSVAVDVSGNCYMGGDFSCASLTFGSKTITNTTVNYEDFFIADYEPDGNVIWAKNAGGINSDYLNSIATDPSGNLFVTGFYYSSTLPFGSTTLINNGEWDIYLAELASSITGINELPCSSTLSVFPNPASDKINIILARKSDIEIVNIEGQIVKTVNNAGMTTVINIENLPGGVYLIKAKTDNGIMIGKFVKQ
jgi:hypothetical protein